MGRIPSARSFVKRWSAQVVGPGPVYPFKRIRRKRFPQERETQGPQTQLREPIQVRFPAPMATAVKLVEVLVPDAIDRAFCSAPKFDRSVLMSRFHCFLRPRWL